MTLRLTIILYVQSVRTRSRVVLSLRSLGWLQETLHRGRMLAPPVVLSIMVMPVVACAPTSTVPPVEPTTAPAVGPIPNPGLRYAEQGLRFERISIKQGLSHSTVNYIQQDSKGFLWFGTSDVLNKYDGYSFAVYRHDANDPHSLGHNLVASLFEDSTGTLWLGTYGGGLNRFDRSLGQFTRYDTDDFQNITDEPEEYRNAVAAVDEYPTGVLWIATHGRELVKFDLETATFTSYAPDPVDLGFWGHEWITALLVDSSGMLWLGTNSEGLYRFDPVTGQTTSYRHDPADPHSLSNDYIPSIIEDEGGTLWIGTSGGGLDAFDPRTETFTHVHHDAIDPSSLSSDRIQTLFLSQSGILWVGTQGGGVNKSDPASGRFTHYRGDPDDPQRRSDYPVSSLLEDEDDTLLEQEGLVAALQAQLQAVEGRAGLRTEPKTDVKERLPADVEEGLYRIAVEALNNALKHAQARNIEVHVSRDRRTVTLTIADDGIGLDLAAARGRGGMGLLAMEERVQEMGGTFAIESTPEQGTRIIVSVP